MVNLFLSKITPVYVLCIAGILSALYFIIRGAYSYMRGLGNMGYEFAMVYSFIAIILFFVILSADRLLAKRLSFGSLFIAECILIVLAIIAFRYKAG